jgi:hypothetical protein
MEPVVNQYWGNSYFFDNLETPTKRDYFVLEMAKTAKYALANINQLDFCMMDKVDCIDLQDFNGLKKSLPADFFIKISP